MDIPDYSMSQEEINVLISKKIRERLEGDLYYDADWEWVGEEPKSKEESPIPSDEAWFDIDGQMWAVTRAWAIKKDFFIPIEMGSCQFLPLTDNLIKSFKEIVSTHSTNLPCHPGLFDNKFRPILEAPGVNVTGRGVHDPAWVEKDGILSAIVMPTKFEDLSRKTFLLSK